LLKQILLIKLILTDGKKLELMKKRQYRSNQGRDPKKNEQTYHTIVLASILFVIAIISALIIKV